MPVSCAVQNVPGCAHCTGTCPTGLAGLWVTPMADAFADYNSGVGSDHSFYFTNTSHLNDNELHMHVYWDELDNYYGITIYYRETATGYAECTGPCSNVAKVTVWLNEWYHQRDSAHETCKQRRATTAHELSHVMGNHHPTYNGSQESSCGQANNDPSVVSTACNRPVAQFPSSPEIYQPQPWDVCGINHSYHDPWFDQANGKWGGCQ